MSSRDLRHLLTALVAIGVACVVPIVLGAPTDLLLAAPVILVALPLLCGRYLGEEAIRRLACAFDGRRPSRRMREAPGSRRREWTLPPRTGALLAHAVGVRPPPAAIAAR